MYSHNVLTTLHQPLRMCDASIWDSLSNFRAFAMAVSHWALPASAFFRPDGSTRDTVDEICAVIPGVLAASRKTAESLTDTESLFRYRREMNFNVQEMYNRWEVSLRAVEKSEAAKKTERELLSYRIRNARKVMLDHKPPVNALVLLDPYGRPLNIHGISLAFASRAES